MVKLNKLLHLHGFYSVVFIAVAIISIISLVTWEKSDFFLVFSVTILLSFLGLGFAISGLNKDKTRALAILGLILSILIISLFFLILVFHKPIID